ncbi:hypothetical protein ACP4OV_014417 [Aristida adscensionis]
MRYTDEPVGGPHKPLVAINIFSVKIASSDVGFPLNVYGTVIARDSIDRKCIYLFRRDRDHCQLINSEDESLILTGPKRGLTLISDDYVEVDLKIRDHEGQDRELSKGVLTIGGIANRRMTKCVIEHGSLATRLSTMDVMYAVMKRAVEGTISVEVLEGEFYGDITAHTTNITNRLVVNDRKSTAAVTGYGKGVIQLMRPVVSVYVKDMLVIVALTDDGKEHIIKFTPMLNGWDEDTVTIGDARMHVKVTWSRMGF